MRDAVKVLEVPIEDIAQIIIWLTVLTGLVILAVVFVRRFRGQGAEDRHEESVLLTKFQEMRHEGDISDAEYRTIKSVLGAKLQREVKGDKHKA